MNGYSKLDVLKFLSKYNPMTSQELQKYFPNHQDFTHLNECIRLLHYDEMIRTDDNNEVNVFTKWVVIPKGKTELKKIEEEREISRKLSLLQISTLETELPLIQKKLKDYNLYKWISIISGIISLSLLLISLFSKK